MTLPVLFLKVHWCWIMPIPIASASLCFLCGGEGSMKEMWAMNSCYWVLQTGKYPGLFLSHAFKDAGMGTAFHPCSMLGCVFHSAVQKSCGYCFFKGLSPPKRAPANDCPCEKVWEDWITGNTMTYWMNWCPSVILVNRLLIVFIQNKSNKELFIMLDPS